MYKVTSRWPHQDTIKIEWNIGKRCNYDCSYCPSEIHDKTSAYTNIEILKSSLDKLSTINKRIRLSFTGGEPCIHPKFEELINYCRTVGIDWISVTTNGTRPYKFYNNLAVDQYVVSIHFEYNWKKAVDNLKKLKKSKEIKLIGQIMAHHDHISSVKHVQQELKNTNIPYTIRRIRWTNGDHNKFDDMRYNSDDLKWIKDHDATVIGNCIIDQGSENEQIIHANDIIKLHLNQYNNWVCSAGIESLMINWDGEVYRATCRVGGSLGNIYKNTFIRPTLPITCTRDWCTCATDIPISKFKPQ